MRLRKIQLRNIRSYKDEEIVFPEGSTLLSGDIGSGKTSILLAIEYALFGLQPGQKGSSLLSNGEDSGEVILEFEVEDNKVKINRKLKRGTKSISQDSSSIEINGERIESSVTEIKTKVLEILNYPQEFIKKNNLLYKYTVYTPQEQMKQIVLEDPQSRLDVIRHIFGIDKYRRIKENLARITLKLREETRMLQFEIKGLDEYKENLSSGKKLVETLKSKISSKSDDLLEYVKKRKILEQQEVELQSKTKEREMFSKEIEKTKIVLSNKRQQLSKDSKLLGELEESISKIKEIFDRDKYELIKKDIESAYYGMEQLNQELISLSSKSESLQERISDDLEKKNRIFKIDICPTCLQDVSDNHKHNILNDAEMQIKKNANERKGIEEQIAVVKSMIEKERSSLKLLEEKKSELEILQYRSIEIERNKSQLESLKKTKSELEKDIDFLEKHVETLKNSSLEFTKYDSLLKLKEKEIKEAFQKEKSLEIEIAEFKKEFELTQKEISQTENRIQEIENVKKRLISTMEIEKWLSDDFSNLIDFTEKKIMLTLRNKFSQLFNKWFSILTSGSLYARLDENFTPIITQGEFELDYEFLSGGERTSVALAYRLALNQIINSILSKIRTKDLVILDEPTDGFSDQQLDKIRDILQELDAKQLIIVSHEPKIESFVDNIIKLHKKEGISLKE